MRTRWAVMAEGVGFEPTVELPLRLISRHHNAFFINGLQRKKPHPSADFRKKTQSIGHYLDTIFGPAVGSFLVPRI